MAQSETMSDKYIREDQPAVNTQYVHVLKSDPMQPKHKRMRTCAIPILIPFNGSLFQRAKDQYELYVYKSFFNLKSETAWQISP